jgi:hypothetical protein
VHCRAKLACSVWDPPYCPHITASDVILYHISCTSSDILYCHIVLSLMDHIVLQDEFLGAVRDAKEHIAAGDIFQLVLSQRFERRTFAEPFEVYRALRIVNPSPYMVYMQVGVMCVCWWGVWVRGWVGWGQSGCQTLGKGGEGEKVGYAAMDTLSTPHHKWCTCRLVGDGVQPVHECTCLCSSRRHGHYVWQRSPGCQQRQPQALTQQRPMVAVSACGPSRACCLVTIVTAPCTLPCHA